MAEAAMEAEEHVVNGQTIIPKLATPDTARLNKTIPELEAQVENKSFFVKIPSNFAPRWQSEQDADPYLVILLLILWN